MGFLAEVRDAFARTFAQRYQTMFGTALVYTTTWGDARIRVLDVDDTYQSATYLDERWCEVPFPYLGLYECVFWTGLPVRNVCMLGGGGYAFPKLVIATHPEARIDVVEIDPAITEIARKHFFLDRLMQEYDTQRDGRLGLVCDDALEYLRKCQHGEVRYDAIVNDCFAAGAAEESLMTAEALRVVRGCLTSTGVYLTNVITALEGEYSGPLVETVGVLSREFDHLYALTCDRREDDELDNVVVVASLCDCELPGALRLYDAV